MKRIWVFAVTLGLAACSSPPEKPTPESASGKQAMAGGQVWAKKLVFRFKDESMSASLAAGVSATSLATALETALKKFPEGEALAAKIEIENNKPLIEVKVFSKGKLYEVEIDAATGKVQEVDDEDDDDDDDDGDDD